MIDGENSGEKFREGERQRPLSVLSRKKSRTRLRCRDNLRWLLHRQTRMSDARSEATEDEIAVCTYFIWEQEGKPVGRALDHWLQAELQLAASLWHESLWYQEGRRSGAPR